MCLTTYLTRTTETTKYYRGVAQLEARDIWDVDAAGSNPVTPTRKRTCNAGPFSTLFAFGESYCYAVYSAYAE